MTIKDLMHRELVDRHVLLARVDVVTTIARELQHDPAFVDDGDTKRQKTSHRIAFTIWRWHDQRGWRDALRNRREERPR